MDERLSLSFVLSIPSVQLWFLSIAFWICGNESVAANGRVADNWTAANNDEDENTWSAPQEILNDWNDTGAFIMRWMSYFGCCCCCLPFAACCLSPVQSTQQQMSTALQTTSETIEISRANLLNKPFYKMPLRINNLMLCCFFFLLFLLFSFFIFIFILIQLRKSLSHFLLLLPSCLDFSINGKIMRCFSTRISQLAVKRRKLSIQCLCITQIRTKWRCPIAHC